jgi:hypothetical protein
VGENEHRVWERRIDAAPTVPRSFGIPRARVAAKQLRRTIQAATNKSEASNKFVQWVCFGGDGVIAENVRDEAAEVYQIQSPCRKSAYLSHAGNPNKGSSDLLEQGHTADREALTTLSPYRTEPLLVAQEDGAKGWGLKTVPASALCASGHQRSGACEELAHNQHIRLVLRGGQRGRSALVCRL